MAPWPERAAKSNWGGAAAPPYPASIFCLFGAGLFGDEVFAPAGGESADSVVAAVFYEPAFFHAFGGELGDVAL
jgi:hypothetical protein